MIKIAGDTHTHTIACQHAYSTVTENICQAAKLGHRFLALTDHAPGMMGCVHNWYFMNLPRFVPRVVEGVVVLRGCEVNVMRNAELDLSDSVLSKLDWVVASMHNNEGLMPAGLGAQAYTETWLKIAENPNIDCIGHFGNTVFACDYERVIKAVAKHGKTIEVNNSSPVSRKGSEQNCLRIIELCKQYDVPIVLSSDAHYLTSIGQVEKAEQLVEQAGYPHERILNLDYARMRGWLMAKKGLELPE